MRDFYIITQAIKEYLSGHPMINTVNIGNISEIDLDKQSIYPLAQMIMGDVNFRNNTIIFNLKVICMDSVVEGVTSGDTTLGIDNKQDVYNSMLVVINGLQSQLRSGSLFTNNFQLDNDPIATPFEDQYSNLLCGWGLDVSIVIPNDELNNCDWVYNLQQNPNLLSEYMIKMNYDFNDDGVVNDSDRLGGHLPTDFQLIEEQGSPNGYPNLDENGLVPLTQLPEGLREPGAQGLTGAQGTVGLTGAQGINGVQGISGTDGIIGVDGVQGTIGATGAQGVIGNTGSQGTIGSQGLTGTQGVIGVQGTIGVGTQGTNGIQGITGTQGTIGSNGVQGITGTDGSFGGATFDYTFSTIITNTDPTQGTAQLDSLTQNESTKLYLDDTDDYGVDIQSFIRTINSVTSTIKGHVRLTSKTDNSQFLLYQISNLFEEIGYFTLFIDCIGYSSISPFTNLEDILISFVVTGDKGDTGVQGTIGSQGVTGTQGTIGTQGVIGNTGTQGTVGTIGSQGTNGTQGLTGVQGTIGSTGVQGVEGPIGGEVTIDGLENYIHSDETVYSYNGGSTAVQTLLTYNLLPNNYGDIKITMSLRSEVPASSANNATYVVKRNGTTIKTVVINMSNASSSGSLTEVTPLILKIPGGNVSTDVITLTTQHSVTNTNRVSSIIFFGLDGIKDYTLGAGPQGTTGVGTQGTNGTQGTIGTQGVIGNTGTQGTIGSNGIQGSTGTQGVIGNTGSQGTVGNTGVQGNVGTQGVIGNQGTVGNTGVQGNVGTQGVIGSQGVIGNQGTVGNTGSTGTQGTVGSTGNTGSQGTVGNTGSQGTIGSNGIQGTIGTQGTVGNTGSQGVIGSTGTQGVSGNNGTQGTVGSTGVQGVIGNTGTQGSVGTQGVTGNTGVQGTIGNTGTQGIVGSTGVQGSVGATGNQGIVGSQGTTGIGTQGVQGVQGVIGTQGTISSPSSTTGTTLNLGNNNGTYYNMSSANAGTTYTTTGQVLGGFAVVLINASSQPSVTGATLIKGATFLSNVEMHLFVQYLGVTTQYFFAQLNP